MKSTYAGLVSLTVIVAIGCGGARGPNVASVEGTVKLDGKVLPHASVTFQPESGRPSFGTTDDQGHYRMVFTKDQSGVMIGNNRVYIRTRREGDSGAVIQQEFLPSRYHDKSELSAVVESKANVIDFDLNSKR